METLTTQNKAPPAETVFQEVELLKAGIERLFAQHGGTIADLKTTRYILPSSYRPQGSFITDSMEDNLQSALDSLITALDVGRHAQYGVPDADAPFIEEYADELLTGRQLGVWRLA